MSQTKTPINKPAAYRSNMAIELRHPRAGAGARRYKDVLTRVRPLCPSRGTSPARLMPHGRKNVREPWSTQESQKQVYAAAILPDGINGRIMRSDERYTKTDHDSLRIAARDNFSIRLLCSKSLKVTVAPQVVQTISPVGVS